MRISRTVKVHEDEYGRVHLPGAVHTALCTVCGFCDVMHEVLDPEEHPADCFLCLAIVAEYRDMRLHNGRLPKPLKDNNTGGAF